MSYFKPTSGTRTHRHRRKHADDRPAAGTWAQFRYDLKDVQERYVKRTSLAHKRFVLLLIAVGAALRVVVALQPITADEALAAMVFGTQPLAGVITDYSLPLNQVLHTILAKWSTSLLGMGLWQLRLPALIAGVMALPMFYLLVRSLFNRYIALMALAMAAGFPGLVQLSALANGFSITWCALLGALLLGRHLVRENNVLSAVLMGLCLALGMWAEPAMIFPALMVLLWVLFSVLSKYERSLNQRLTMLGIGAGVFVAATLLLYMPVVMSHGVDQLFHHVTEGELSWKAFSTQYPDRVLVLWMWIVDPTYAWVAYLGFAGLVHAAYTSAKYRTLLFALVLGAVPLSLMLADAGEPHQWAYALFIFHIGSSIALFYLLKFVQDRVIKGFGKRSRTGWAALVLVLGFGLPGLQEVMERGGRMPEAASAVDVITHAFQTGDRLCTSHHWEHALRFELLCHGVELADISGTADPGRMLFVVVEQPRPPDLDLVLQRCDQQPEDYELPAVVKDWPRMEIFAARKR